MHHVGGGAHDPPEHTGVLAGHAFPQRPQLLASLSVSTHSLVVGQYVVVVPVHVTPHEVPSQLGMPDPLDGPAHAMQDIVPHDAVLMLLTHAPLHAWVPPEHAQLPATHCMPDAHA